MRWPGWLTPRWPRWLTLESLKQGFSLDPEERQSLMTWSMIFGAVAMTVMTAVLIGIIRDLIAQDRWSPHDAFGITVLAIKIFANIIYGLLSIVALAMCCIAAIAIGGKVKGRIFGNEFSAEINETKVTTSVDTTGGVQTKVETPPTTPPIPDAPEITGHRDEEGFPPRPPGR